MSDQGASFDYLALDPAGRRIKGRLTAASDTAAFEQLKREGLSPLSIKRGAGGALQGKGRGERGQGLSERETAEFLADLAALLGAGADMRASLSILGARGGRPAIRALSRALSAEISGGTALDRAFSRHLGKNSDFLGALVAAGEAGGDLAGGLQRAADMMGSRLRLRDQLVSALSYPTFVFVSTMMAVAVILFFVVPSLAPLVEDAGGKAPLSLAVMIGVSDFLRSNLWLILGGLAALAISLTVAGSSGALARPIEMAFLEGPARKTISGLVYGAFGVGLGDMLTAGAPMSDALRLAIRSIRSRTAQARLEAVAHAVRQGERLSDSLGQIRGFPDSIVRLAAVGEASGGLGPMLSRAGKLEEEAAIRRIEAVGRLLGPLLIVLLGGMIGLLMAGLLSGVSQLGQAALQ